MPHLAFYATSEDVLPIVRFVLGECQVFESFSAPDSPLRQFVNPVEVQALFNREGLATLGLILYAPSMGGEFSIDRYELKPDAISGKSWRERISGWGMIQIQFTAAKDGKLRPSFTNHNSATRARHWADSYPNVPSVDAWDFREVARISRRINRYISGLAIQHNGSRPILPSAHATVARGEIILEPN